VVAPQLAELVESGQLRVEFKQFPLNDAESVWAVEAVECAADQGMWYAMHSHIFANQGRQKISTALTEQYAADLGLDTEAFKQCVRGDKYKATAETYQKEAEDRGLRGTPAFFLNGEAINLDTLKSWNDIPNVVKQAVNK